jgi:sugar phosphate isomerase/epimerase
MKIAVSSGCFMCNEIDKIVSIARKIGIETIELSANVKHNGRAELVKTLKRYSDMRFLIHHYFPAPNTPFVCNIAHPATVEKSCEFIKKNIKMCGDLGIPYYSLHAGYGINPKATLLGSDQSLLVPIPYEQSLNIFVDNAIKLEKFADQYKVKLLWENNVVAFVNQFENTRTPYLFSDIKFLEELENDSWWKNALVLLDIGHLKVSANTLKFSIDEFMERISQKVVHIHASDNDGLVDNNKPLTNETFVLFNKLKTFTNLKFLILEVSRISLTKIQEQIALIRNNFAVV